MTIKNPTNYLTDEAFLAKLGHALARRRVRQALTQEELARQAGVGKRTVERFETGRSIQMTSFLRILRVLDLLPELEALMPEPGPTPMELLQSKAKEKQRASSLREQPRAEEPWTWGKTP